MIRIDPFDVEDVEAVVGFFREVGTSDLRFGGPHESPSRAREDVLNRLSSAWIGWRDDQVTAAVWAADAAGDGRTGLIRAAERPGPAAQSLLWQTVKAAVGAFCRSGFENLEIASSPQSPAVSTRLRRLGFRHAPALGPRFENFLPAILRHRAASSYLSRGDLFQGLRLAERAAGDNMIAGRTDLFVYSWQRGGERMEVSVDWRRRNVAAVAREKWQLWCAVAREIPFEIFYYLKSRARSSIDFRLRVRSGPSSPPRTIPPGGACSGLIRVADPPRRLVAGATLDWELAGQSITFGIRRFRRHFRSGAKPVVFGSEGSDCAAISG